MIDVASIQNTLLDSYTDRRTEFQIGRAGKVAKNLAARLEAGASAAQIRGMILAEYPATARPDELTKRVMIGRYRQQ
jgi:hypothetical protein